MTKRGREECGWGHTSEGVDKFGISWHLYRVDKPIPAGMIMLEPMGTYWELKTEGQIQWGEWREYVSKINRTDWGGFTGATNTEQVYKGHIPDKQALMSLMKWLGINNV